MAQFEYQVLEQAGGRISHLNERLQQMVSEGWEPTLMTGTAPQVSIMMRRPAPAAAAPATRPAAAAAAPRPAAPGAAPRPAGPPPRPQQ